MFTHAEALIVTVAISAIALVQVFGLGWGRRGPSA